MNKKTIVYCDGKFQYYENVNIGLLSNSLNFGTGAIDSVRLYKNNGEYYAIGLERYLERFLFTANTYIYTLDIPFPQFRDIIIKLLKMNSHLEAPYMRVIAFQGDATLDFSHDTEDLHFAIIPLSFQVHKKYDISLVFSQALRENESAYKRKFSYQYGKNLFYIQQQGLRNTGQVVLFLDKDRNMLECISENIFFVKGECIYSPSQENILRGVNREIIISFLILKGFQVIETLISVDDISTFEEVFISGSATSIRSVRFIDQKEMFKSTKISDLVRTLYEGEYKNIQQLGELNIEKLL